MHILVVNDDGPPSSHASPYVHMLVRQLQASGHLVSVCLPDTQRSWIGKAHLIGQTIKPTYYRPPRPPANPAGLVFGRDVPESFGTTHRRPATRQPRRPAECDEAVKASGAGDGDDVPEEWVLVDGTPASCVQIGLHHMFKARGPVDLVLSGPNYGRNTTALFALSSGTLGGALEGASCRIKSVALSFAFFGGKNNHDPAIVAAACRHAVRVVESLVRQWPTDGSVDLYSVNVPLVEGVEGRRNLWAGMLQNYWAGGGCFVEAEGSVGDPEEEEERIREGGLGEAAGDGDAAPIDPKMDAPGHEGCGDAPRHFKWQPRLTDVYKSVEEAPTGNDGWVVKEGNTSITPLKANFWQAAQHLYTQELQLASSVEDNPGPASPAGGPGSPQSAEGGPASNALPSGHDGGDAATTHADNKLYALIAYEDVYVQPLILKALEGLLPSGRYQLLKPPQSAREAAESDDHRTDDGGFNEPISLAKLLADSSASSATACDQSAGSAKVLQITPYEAIDFDFAASHPNWVLINSYTFRKALIRKHFLSATVEAWLTKHPQSVLASHVKQATAFEVDYAEFLDDALIEAWDLRASLERNESCSSRAVVRSGTHDQEPGGCGDQGGIVAAGVDSDEQDMKEWWILKPSMSDRGQGIRLFSTMGELQAIFDEWEENMPDSEDDEDDTDGRGSGNDDGSRTTTTTTTGAWDERQLASGADFIMAAHLRHFVAQPYIHPPLLLPSEGGRKFHIRTYVVCVGRLKVYVYRPMLALFAGKSYSPPSASADVLSAHLTNTCLTAAARRISSGSGSNDTALPDGDGVVKEFWSLSGLPSASSVDATGTEGEAVTTKEAIFEQICNVTGELFEAAARGMPMHFQPLEHAFEVFGLDFLVDARGQTWLLEVNAFPDFKQTGDELRGLVAALWAGVLRLAVWPFLGLDDDRYRDEATNMVLVKDIELGRTWTA